MKSSKKKLTAEEIVEFFQSKPVFDKSETDSSILYGWPSTRNGLYTISDIYKYFEAKGFTAKAVDDCLYTYFQKADAFTSMGSKLEKGKTHRLSLLRVMNHNPDYKQTFVYYLYDITKEEAYRLKRAYEAESLALMETQITKRKSSVKHKSATQKLKEEKKARKPRAKKTAIVEPKIEIELV